jgi:peptidoglycan L-alanyl-D-glutamate endopeptidase CwlK
MTYNFGNKSLEKLSTVHPDLQKLFKEAITNSPYDFSITEGVRSLERQKELVAAKKSTTMHSRHLTGHAVDIAVIVDGKISWDIRVYKAVADHIKNVAKLMSIPIEWGGDWKSFIDGPHFQLPEKVYL